MKTLFSIIIALTAIVPMQAKTLIAYYSYTQNTHTIVTELASMIEADVLRIEPAEKDLTMLPTIMPLARHSSQPSTTTLTICHRIRPLTLSTWI